MQTRIRHLEELERSRPRPTPSSSLNGVAPYTDSPRNSSDLSASTLLAQHLRHSTSVSDDPEAARAAHLITDLIEGDEDAQLRYRDEDEVDDLRYTDTEGESDAEQDLLLEEEVGGRAEELRSVRVDGTAHANTGMEGGSSTGGSVRKNKVARD